VHVVDIRGSRLLIPKFWLEVADNSGMATASLTPKASHLAGDGPLSIQHQQQLNEATQRVGKVLTATRLATFNAWSTSVFAIFSLLAGIFSLTALVVGLGLSLVAWNEFRGRNMLRWFDARSPRVLGWNQVGFLGLLVGYSVWSIYVGLVGPDPYETYIKSSPELRSMLGSIQHLHKVLTLAIYGGVIVLSLVFQGFNAVYYFSRAKYLQAYLDQTPKWIVQIQQQGAR